ncbi:MAG: hypothetical protein PVI67_16490, partial [Anaerolineae bacterium]
MMKSKAVRATFAILMIFTMVTSVLADDGFLVRKSMSKEGQLNPLYQGELPEAEHAFIQMMKFYVPMQAANGTVAPIDYYNVDEALVEERDSAKPLIGVYINGPVEGVEGTGFVGHGLRDAFGAVSLDDGITWKNTNLSESAGLSSSEVVRTDIPLFSGTEYAYPGDVVNIFHAVAGSNVLVAWPSRYCESGQPNYSLDTDDPTPEQAA